VPSVGREIDSAKIAGTITRAPSILSTRLSGSNSPWAAASTTLGVSRILGLYNLDLFRQALPSVAPRLALTPAAVEEATHSDEALLALGLRWVAAELGITEIYLQRSVRGL
jgi:hypothetical protein